MKNFIRKTVRRATGKTGATRDASEGVIADVAHIRKRARRHIENGAVTDDYKADRDAIIKLLNEALATELVCALRYRRHHFMATGLEAEPAAAEFLEHANEEMQHADSLATRIVQLGGEPDFSPAKLADRSHSEYVPCNTLREMLQENLVAERLAIDIYGRIIRFIGEDDPTTRRMLEDILANEEEHADDLASLLDRGETQTAIA